VCATSKGAGTITGVTAGTDLTGGGTSGSVTLNLDTTKFRTDVEQHLHRKPDIFRQRRHRKPPQHEQLHAINGRTANSFGTWLAIANSSSGGHTWNIISAGAGNAEGAGNIGITDLTARAPFGWRATPTPPTDRDRRRECGDAGCNQYCRQRNH